MDLNAVSKETRLNFRSDLIGHFQRSREELLPALHWVQEEYGYLPEWTLEILSWHLGVPASEVYGAVTSYPELSLAVPQTHKISVCTGLACRESGSQDLLNKSLELFDKDGSATSVYEVPCLFSCSVAPVVLIDGVLAGNTTEKLITSEVDYERD